MYPVALNLYRKLIMLDLVFDTMVKFFDRLLRALILVSELVLLEVDVM